MPKFGSIEAFIQYEKELHQRFWGGEVKYDMMIAEDDKVAAYATFTGHHLETGKQVENEFLAMFRIAEKKIAEIWVAWDNISSLAQLGLYAAPTNPN